MMAMIARTTSNSTRLNPPSEGNLWDVRLLMARPYSKRCARGVFDCLRSFISLCYVACRRRGRPIRTLQGATSRNAAVGAEGGQAYAHDQSSGGAVGQDEVALMQLDDLEGNGKAETEASGFGSEERPQSLARGGRDAGAVIRDGDHDRIALASGSDPDVPLF